MKKLTIKELAPYLPYQLKMYWEELITNQPKKPWILDIDSLGDALYFQNKPILRPISDLTKEIKVNGEKFVPIIKLAEEIGYYQPRKWKHVYYEDSIMLRTDEGLIINVIQFNLKKPLNNYSWIIFKLFEWHFDVFGLIEQGLAIDINTLQNER